MLLGATKGHTTAACVCPCARLLNDAHCQRCRAHLLRGVRAGDHHHRVACPGLPTLPPAPTCFFSPAFSLFSFWGLYADSLFYLFETTPTATLPHNEIIIIWHQWGILAPSPSNVDALRALKRPVGAPFQDLRALFFTLRGLITENLYPCSSPKAPKIKWLMGL